MPCFGLDEAHCSALATKEAGDLCEAIYGNHTYPNHGDDDPQQYIGCKTFDGGNVGDVFVCAHPKGEPNQCAEPRSTDIPDGWVECSMCDCTGSLKAADCVAGSHNACCCRDYPNSLPCEGLDEFTCEEHEVGDGGWCAKIMGKAWDPAAQQGVGSKMYLGCRSTCVPENPHGDPTCTHPADDAMACDVTTDARIPDGWSTDCSACAPPE